MEQVSHKLFTVHFFLIFILLFCIPIQGHEEDDVVNVYDREGNHIFSSALQLTIGDRYLSEDNYKYQIIDQEGDRAIAKKIKKIDLKAASTETRALNPFYAQNGEKKDENPTVAIYHTHNGESYIPGPVNVQGPGEIHNVGLKLGNKLKEKGINVLNSDNLHLPHDGASYTRSRVTALQLARQGVDVILDIHRDAVPDSSEYLTSIEGEETVQVRLVVGRQNPNRKVNEQFAYNLKAISDQKKPGLIKDVLYGQGEYNQSLHPRSLLLEMGTHKNNKDQIHRSAAMTAGLLSSLLYGEVAGKAREANSAWVNIFWILFVLILVGTGYLYLLEGSWPGVKKRLKNFFSREIIDRGE